MEVSLALTEALKTRFGEDAPPLLEEPAGRWFCPRCATLAVLEEGALRCPRGCGSLNSLLRDLEATPHWLTC
jgi:hypothetical protein